MRNFQQKRGLKHILHSRPVLILLSLLVLFFAWGVVGFIGKMRLTMENKEIVSKKVAELEQKKEELRLDIEKLNSDEGREESIREKFGLVKDGEGVIVIVEDKNKAKNEKNREGGFFSFFRNWFK